MELNLKKIDIIITIISLILVGLLTFYMLGAYKVDSNSEVFVYIDNVEVWRAPLNKDDEKVFFKSDYDVLLDDLKVEIKNSKVRIAEEVSPRNYCSKLGYVSIANFPLICAPNKTKVIIKGPNSGIVLK